MIRSFFGYVFLSQLISFINSILSVISNVKVIVFSVSRGRRKRRLPLSSIIRDACEYDNTAYVQYSHCIAAVNKPY
jgi:hypothetical protein